MFLLSLFGNHKKTRKCPNNLGFGNYDAYNSECEKCPNAWQCGQEKARDDGDQTEAGEAEKVWRASAKQRRERENAAGAKRSLYHRITEAYDEEAQRVYGMTAWEVIQQHGWKALYENLKPPCFGLYPDGPPDMSKPNVLALMKEAPVPWTVDSMRMDMNARYDECTRHCKWRESCRRGPQAGRKEKKNDVGTTT